MNYLDLAKFNVAEKYPIIAHATPFDSDIPPGAILGTWAISVPGKIRWITHPEREIATGVLPSDLTRAWLNDCYKLPIRRTLKQVQEKCYPHPQYAQVGHFENCCYVDIRQAYLSILRLGYDVEYMRGRYVGANFQPVPDEVEKHKLSYAVAVSMSHSNLTNIAIMGKNGPFMNHHFNNYSNPSLYNLASDTLACIASEVLRIFKDSVHYINTDGFIVDTNLAPQLTNVIQSWGFEARVKAHGETWVWGAGSWKVGNERTKRKDPHPKDFKSVMPEKQESTWLKGKILKLLDETRYRLDLK